MLELLLLIVAVAVGGFLLLGLVLKLFLWAVTIPIQLGAWAIKGVLGLVVGIPLAIIGFITCSVILPVLGALVPVFFILMLLLAIPLLLVGLFVGCLKLVF